MDVDSVAGSGNSYQFHPEQPKLPLEIIGLVADAVSDDDRETIHSVALVNRHLLFTARRRIFGNPILLNSTERCTQFKDILDSDPRAAVHIKCLEIHAGDVPQCVSVHEADYDQVDPDKQYWLCNVPPVWRGLPNLKTLYLSFFSADFLLKWSLSLKDFASDSIQELDLYHVDFDGARDFQEFISSFKGLRKLTMSRVDDLDPAQPWLHGPDMPLLPDCALTPPPLKRLILRSTSFLEDTRPMSQWLLSQRHGAELRELWYIYDDNLYYSYYHGDIVRAAAHSVEKLCLGFEHEGLWEDQDKSADELAKFDDDMRAIGAMPKLRSLKLLGDLSVRCILSAFHLAPPTLEELIFHTTASSSSWMSESTASRVWRALLDPRFAALKRIVFDQWGSRSDIKSAERNIKAKLGKHRVKILHFKTSCLENAGSTPSNVQSFTERMMA